MSADDEVLEPALRAVGLNKSFQGVRALHDVSVSMYPGRVLGIVGPNGAGKSTLLAGLTGFLDLDTGEVWAGGVKLNGKSPDSIASEGLVVRTFQSTRVLHLPARDNVVMGAHRFGWRNVFSSLFAVTPRGQRKEEEELDRKARQAWEDLRLPEPSRTDLDYSDAGKLRLLQICRAVAANAKVLLLDEPTAGLDRNAAEDVCNAVLALRERGVAVALIEHDLGIVKRVCDRVLVLDNGGVVAEGTPAEIAVDKATAVVYAGQEAAWI